jgi:hypothetical protein
VASSADEFVAYVSKLLAGTVTVHHGHMPEIGLEPDRDPRADVPGLRPLCRGVREG